MRLALCTLLLSAVCSVGAAAAPVFQSPSCPVPVLAMFNVCAPFGDAPVTSPVAVLVSGTVPQGTLTGMQVWVDGVKKFSTSGNLINTSISLATGTRRFTFIMTNSGGKSWNTIVYVPVQ
jgi:hypothetical protein